MTKRKKAQRAQRPPKSSRAPKKKAPTKRRKTPMSRTADLKDVERGLQQANEAINAIVQKLRVYEAEIQKLTTALFEKAGIIEQVEKLETQLKLARQRAQEKVNVHRAEAAKLEQVKAYLVDKMTDEAPEAPDLSLVGDNEDDGEGDDADKADDTEEPEGEDEDVPAAPEF
jgi:predicted  nucleic acid-binding Zn-ribbon protein